MGRLTTHVLDTASGRPAAGMRVRLLGLDAPAPLVLADTRTNADGRLDAPLLDAGALRAGRYRLEFSVAQYHREQGIALADPPFLDVVVLDFGVADPRAHYHVPLLVTPWSYSTYRGS